MGVCLVVPGRDEDAAALAAVASDLQVRGAMLASGPSQPVLAAYDKAATATALGACGLPIAATAEDVAGAVEIADAHGWPLVLKPRRGNSSRGVRLVWSEEGLHASFRTESDIAQEYLAVSPEDRRSWDGRFPGGQDGEYSLQLLLDCHGREIGHFCSRNTLANGVPLLVETIAEGQVGDLLRQACAALGSLSAWGAWNLQGRRSLDGAIRVFEVNARPTGITGLRAWLGFNELDLLYDALILGHVTSRPKPIQPGLLIDVASFTALEADGHCRTLPAS
jgi:predicted ATP-grasp superfamily ATP-dependent carboligase